jgi:hypothetical protein
MTFARSDADGNVTPSWSDGRMSERDVINKVWEEVGGELVPEFDVSTIPGQPKFDRHVDAVFALGGPPQEHPKHHRLPLCGRRAVICQAKSGQLDLGVLGQTFFSAQLIQREFEPCDLRLIAAAVRPNPMIDRLVASYEPGEWRVECVSYPDLERHASSKARPGRSSGEDRPPGLRRVIAGELHREAKGLLIEGGGSGTYFGKVQVASTGESLRQAEPDAIILPRRDFGRVPARSSVVIAEDEPVILVHTSRDFYMTSMGRAVFGRQLALDQLGLTNLRSVFCYRNDNEKLRELIGEFSDIEVMPG